MRAHRVKSSGLCREKGAIWNAIPKTLVGDIKCAFSECYGGRTCLSSVENGSWLNDWTASRLLYKLQDSVVRLRSTASRLVYKLQDSVVGLQSTASRLVYKLQDSVVGLRSTASRLVYKWQGHGEYWQTRDHCSTHCCPPSLQCSSQCTKTSKKFSLELQRF